MAGPQGIYLVRVCAFAVFEREMEKIYNLKLKAAREVYSDISARFPTMPFPLRELEPKVGAFGLKVARVVTCL